MKLEIIDALKDDELQSVIERAQGLLKDRDEKRKEEAIADAIARLAAGWSGTEGSHRQRRWEAQAQRRGGLQGRADLPAPGRSQQGLERDGGQARMGKRPGDEREEA